MPDAPISILAAASGGVSPTAPVVILGGAAGGGSPTAPEEILGEVSGGGSPSSPVEILADGAGGGSPADPAAVLSSASGSADLVFEMITPSRRSGPLVEAGVVNGKMSYSTNGTQTVPTSGYWGFLRHTGLQWQWVSYANGSGGGAAANNAMPGSEDLPSSAVWDSGYTVALYNPAPASILTPASGGGSPTAPEGVLAGSSGPPQVITVVLGTFGTAQIPNNNWFVFSWDGQEEFTVQTSSLAQAGPTSLTSSTAASFAANEQISAVFDVVASGTSVVLTAASGVTGFSLTQTHSTPPNAVTVESVSITGGIEAPASVLS